MNKSKKSLLIIAFLVIGLNCNSWAQEDSVGYVSELHDLMKDAEPANDLNNAMPQQDYLLFSIMPKSYAQFKKNFFDKTGIQFGLSYQTLLQRSSASLTEKDVAWGGWFLFEFSWILFNRGKDYQGRLVATLDDRHIINPEQNQSPAFFRRDIGSLWATDAAFLNWDIYPATLFWEQDFKKDRLRIRVGQFGALAELDFFRFADPRTSFSNSQLSAPVAMIPISPPGFGASIKWWPIADSELYVLGLINDSNAKVGEIDWSSFFEIGETFKGAEIGYNIFRSKQDFDHVHATFWHVDSISTKPFPTKAGWGFKLHGSKQLKRWVIFGNYAYNTAEGGGFSFTNTQQGINLGAALVKPLNIRGELSLAGSWGQPIDQDLRNQTGIETYWKVLLGSDFWVTAGIQCIWNPTYNTNVDFLAIPHIKARIFI